MALRVPRSVPEDADLVDVPDAPRAYGGHPSPLADAENRALAERMLCESKSCAAVAKALGYHGASAFSDAFLKLYEERPSAFARRMGAAPVKRRQGKRTLTKRGVPDRTKAKPLPRYDARSKAPKKKSKKTGRKKQAA